MKLVATILLASLVLVSAMDNCTKSYHYMCGDVCLYNNGVCECGDRSLKRADLPSLQCCATGCTVAATGSGRTRRVQCTNNAAVRPLSDGCKTDITINCNYYPTDPHRNYYDPAYPHYLRSHWPCSSGDECVPEHSLCHGEPMCQDKSDIGQCESQEWQEKCCSTAHWRKSGGSTGE